MAPAVNVAMLKAVLAAVNSVPLHRSEPSNRVPMKEVVSPLNTTWSRITSPRKVKWLKLMSTSFMPVKS